MTAELIGAVAAVFAAGAIAVTLRRDNPVFALLIAASAAVFAVWTALRPLREVTDELFKAVEEAGLRPGVLTALLKCTAIGIISRLGSELLRESGLLAASSGVELMGVAAGLWAMLPLLRELIETVRSGL